MSTMAPEMSHVVVGQGARRPGGLGYDLPGRLSYMVDWSGSRL